MLCDFLLGLYFAHIPHYCCYYIHFCSTGLLLWSTTIA